MSSINMADRQNLEKLLKMSSGFVLDFSDRTFREFVLEAVGMEIHSERFSANGTSKANKLRTFCKIEADQVVGQLLTALIDYKGSLIAEESDEDKKVTEKCRQLAARLLAAQVRLDPLKEQAKLINASHLAEQIRRIEASVDADPSLAIGTAKELLETCCKTILAERGKPVEGTPDLSTLTKATFKELKLVPEGIPEAAKGAEVIKRLLSNLATICHGLAELRGLYGTGHGKHGSAAGLGPRHAKLAVGAASTLAVFLFETHKATAVSR
jgi:hypothetical protein